MANTTTVLKRGCGLLLAAFVVLTPTLVGAQAPAPKGALPPGHSGTLPDTPKKRAKLLRDLYALLATAQSEEEAGKAAHAIERLWLSPGSDTVSVLMERAVNAAGEKNFTLAIKLLDTIVELAPDYSEAWNRRAYVHYLQDDVGRALGDLRRVLALDPNHFKALDGLAQILKELGQKKAAYEVYKRLLEVHPYWKPAEQAIEELKRDVEGQGL
jgi:tetratricopeptide (TPR) repeat protein